MTLPIPTSSVLRTTSTETALPVRCRRSIIGEDGVVRLGIIHDCEDLHVFNVFFDSVTIRNTTETDGVEVMWSHDAHESTTTWPSIRTTT